MNAGGRIQTVIDLLTAIEAAPHRPADGTARAFFRERRYVGAKDRRVVADLAWAVLRSWARLGWWANHIPTRVDINHPGISLCPARIIRLYVLAHLLLVDGYTMEDLVRLSHDTYGLTRLSHEELDLLADMAGHTLDHPAMPCWVHDEVPPWLEALLRIRFGAALERELASLNREAPLDLRVNTLKATREQVRTLLAADGIESSPTPFSPFGLRVTGRVNVAAQLLFREGMVEVQDEGSQIAALLVSVAPGQTVLDYCAGAGGKTMALAANMVNKGRLVACDVSRGRMERAAVRLRRADVHNTTFCLLDGNSEAWHKHALGRFDRVLADVPCTGTGTWRRNPDARWRLRLEDMAELIVRQDKILAQTGQLVRPRGRLIYVTCSLLPAENETRVEQFLTKQPWFQPIPAAQAWTESVGSPWPFGTASPFLHLTPAQHGTDGYFVAVLEREGQPKCSVPHIAHNQR